MPRLIVDEVETLSKSRLLVIKIFSRLALSIVSQEEKFSEQQKPSDPQNHSLGLHLLLYIFTFLLPNQTLQNRQLKRLLDA